jgi:hypothetical protein
MVTRVNRLGQILAIQPAKQGAELSVEDGDELRVAAVIPRNQAQSSCAFDIVYHSRLSSFYTDIHLLKYFGDFKKAKYYLWVHNFYRRHCLVQRKTRLVDELPELQLRAIEGQLLGYIYPLATCHSKLTKINTRLISCKNIF